MKLDFCCEVYTVFNHVKTLSRNVHNHMLTVMCKVEN